MAKETSVHCPSCGAAVPATPGAAAAACLECGTAFAPWGLPTAARPISVAPDAPAPHGGPDDDLVGTVVGGRRLLRVVGRGGMGTVYEAEDARRGRVAVKVLPAALAADPHFVARFRRESSVLSGLSHPHLVEVFERGEDGRRCWFVMELVRGESLRRVMERGPVPWRDAVRRAREILAGLGYAHGRGVVHRDLKPENVLLDAEDRARLVDFGLSRIVRGEAAEDLSRLTRTNVVLGTYEYMAPEQRLGKTVDARADLYALGVMLYEMLSGSLPLGRFEAASVLRPGVPATLDAVVHRALAPRPEDRFPSAVAFREALDAAERAAGAERAEPVAAPPAAAAPGNAPSSSPVADDEEPEAMRRARQHVERIAAADRVLGVLGILVALGVVSLGSFVGLWFPFGFAGVVSFVAGIWLLGLGGRVSRLERGARESQLFASVLLLLAPPLGTLLGIYGLVVMSSDAMRALFDGHHGGTRPRPRHGIAGSWSERSVEVRPARPRRVRDLVGHALVVWSVAVVGTTTLLVTTTRWADWHLPMHEVVPVAVGAGAGFTVLWFLFGRRTTAVLTVLAAALALVLLTRGGRSPSPSGVPWQPTPPLRQPPLHASPTVPVPVPAPPPRPPTRGDGTRDDSASPTGPRDDRGRSGR
ncbi:MAG: serine/threonine protein kinase [Planctomycetes bacterium]|nr:serine/threonine protein kinase [Planctomycetota bacterium]